jgi:hypothetical protein
VSETRYQPDQPGNATDALILAGSGPEPPFDAVMQAFLIESYLGLKRSCALGGLLSFASLGLVNPWLFRLTFRTRGFVRAADGEVATVDRHVVALRFPSDYLRNADRFSMLRLIEPVGDAFHPNISPVGAICVEIYPGESLVEICQSLHDLFRWRLRQYDERDALNSAACAWGRENIDKPIDDRPLFGQRLKLQWHAANP